MNDDKLIAYKLVSVAPRIEPAPARRNWMEQTDKGFAKRCLPLVMANQYGWDLLTVADFTATWSGGADKDAISIEGNAGGLVQSHFGHGILTFQIGYLFRTRAGLNLHVRGPSNRPKPGAYPLEGVVETDWSSAPFTMNWQLLFPGESVSFEKDEPFCTILPYPRALLERQEPTVRPIRSEKAEFDAYESWRTSRQRFLIELNQPQTDAHKQKWQKDYFRGRRVDGDSSEQHQTKLELRDFKPHKT